VPGATQLRRQPRPLAPIHSKAPGSGNQAHAPRRPGTPSANAAQAALIAVATAPMPAQARSGVAAQRRSIGPAP